MLRACRYLLLSTLFLTAGIAHAAQGMPTAPRLEFEKYTLPNGR